MTELIGRTLLGRYRVEASLGRGGMAEVYKVWDEHRSVHLAMKLLREDLAEDKIFLRRFRREAQTLERLQHPNIVRFYGLEQDGDLAFMLMDYVEGTTLRKEILRAEGPFSLDRALEILRPICAALHYAHREGMVHCDVKPGNIMIDAGGKVLITDFGIARMTESATATMVGLGTPAYMAPELVRGEDPTAQTDIYALGVVLYEMLTGGERPFTGERATITGSTSEKVRWEQAHLEPPSPRKWNADLLPEAESVVATCLAKSPEERYGSALEFLQALEAGSASSQEVESASGATAAAVLADQGKAFVPESGPQLQGWDEQVDLEPRPSTRVFEVQKADTAPPSLTIARPQGVAASFVAVMRQAAQKHVLWGIAPVVVVLIVGALVLGSRTESAVPLVQLARLGRGTINQIAISPDETTIAVAGGTGAWLYDMETLEPTQFMAESSPNVQSVAWSPDGRRLAAGCLDSSVFVADINTGSLEYVLEDHTSSVRRVAWSPDGTRIASGDDDGVMRIWDAASGLVLQVIEVADCCVDDLAWSPDSGSLATAYRGGTVQIWDAQSGDELRTFEANTYTVRSVAWSPDGGMLASGSGGLENENTVIVWDVASGERLFTLEGQDDFVGALAWSDDGSSLASGSYGGTLVIWDMRAGTQSYAFEGGHDSWVATVAWLHDGSALVSGGQDGTIRMWNLVTGEEDLVLSSHTGRVDDVDWSHDGARIASADWGGVRIWDAGTGLEQQVFPRPYYPNVEWSNDDRRLIGSRGGEVVIWDASSGVDVRSVQAHDGSIERVAWSPDGAKVASVGVWDEELAVWDSALDQEIARIEGVRTFAWSPESNRLALGGEAGIRIWDSVARRVERTWEDEGGNVYSLDWSPDGERIAALLSSTTGDETTNWISIWDVDRDRRLRTIQSEEFGWSSVLVWSPDSRQIATSGWDDGEEVLIWDASSGRLVYSGRGHGWVIESLDWSPDGSRLASGSWDGTVRIWGVPER
jgi:WD40 repeat protein/tRNA A-37 threonylcarbamoyl transferase component Bud32